jgi:glutamate decarboxylase
MIMVSKAEASAERVAQIFTVPTSPDSTLGQIDAAITADVAQFLNERIVALEAPMEAIEERFAEFRIPEEPEFVSDYTERIGRDLLAHSVHTSSPGFVGHMTSALPYFMLPLSRILTALNQNVVKVETSKAFTPLERQTLAMMHRLVYGQDDEFYRRWTQNSSGSLGAMCSGGTVANLTALWVARNRLFPAGAPSGGSVAEVGLATALVDAGWRGVAVFVSKRGHYSLSKAVDVLGLGRASLVSVETDSLGRVDLGVLNAALDDAKARRILPMAVVGIAGATETGAVDPLSELADVAAERGCHFHVDAAWGGPTLFSDRYRHLLGGIERADSVTIDAHKQMYVPMGIGMALFADPEALNSIEHHANYILRAGSRDLGSRTLEGSRPGIALLAHAGLSIIGRKGYELLIDAGIERARWFAEEIRSRHQFELVTEPTLNILTYRFVPPALRAALRSAGPQERRTINEQIDALTVEIQKRQREAGETFVSRTRLPLPDHPEIEVAVFRVVLANPLTTESILRSMLDEQMAIAAAIGA